MPKDTACTHFLSKQPGLHSICAGNMPKGSANRNETTPLHVYFAARATYVSLNVQTITDFSPLEKTQCLFVDQL